MNFFNTKVMKTKKNEEEEKETNEISIGTIILLILLVLLLSVGRPIMLKHEQEKADKAKKIEQLKTHQK